MVIRPVGQSPIVGFVLDKATSKTFLQLVADFTEWCKQQPQPAALNLKDGWVTFTPELSLLFLHHTVLSKGNRRPSLATVLYYAVQMQEGDWKKTGETVVVDTEGHPLNGQHRAWASVLANVTFETFVCASAPAFENAFAYMDNVKMRSAADALETAGLDGNSKVLASVVRLARHYDAGVMTPTSKGTVPKASPITIMRYVQHHPELVEAVRLQMSEYKDATDLLRSTDVAGFTAWKIMEAFDEDMLDDFMTALTQASSDGPNAEAVPLVALKKKLLADKDAAKPMKKFQVLAHIIKAFRAWHFDQPMKTVSVRVDEKFPRFPAATDSASEPAAA